MDFCQEAKMDNNQIQQGTPNSLSQDPQQAGGQATIIGLDTFVEFSDAPEGNTPDGGAPEGNTPAAVPVIPTQAAPVAETPEKPVETPAVDSYEKRYKDLQAAYTKSRQEIAVYKNKIVNLEQLLDVSSVFDEQTREQLEALKFANPDEWRRQLNDLEAKAKAKIEHEASTAAEVERRQILLQEYNAANPQHQITDYVVDFVLPRGLINKLEKQEVTFDAFLAEASAYLKNTSFGNKNEPMSTDNAGKKSPIIEVGGGVTSTGEQGEADIQWW